MKLGKYGEFFIKNSRITLINRLKTPFKSNCSIGENDLSVFPPPYTRQKCKDTIYFFKMLSLCDDVPDHWQQFVKPHHSRGWKYSAWNKTDLDVLECLHRQYRSMLWTRVKVPMDICPLPCHEIITENVLKQKNRAAISISGIKVEIPSSRITAVHEIATYTSDDLLAEIGSWLGLLVGMSFLSLVEIVAFLCTVIREKCS